MKQLIDTLREQVYALNDLRAFAPLRRGGKRIALATLYRYTNKGYRGVRLEYLQFGNTRVSSREALARFMERITRLNDGDVVAEDYVRQDPPLTEPQIDKMLVETGFDRRSRHSRRLHDGGAASNGLASPTVTEPATSN